MEALSFSPFSRDQLVSVGQDRQCVFWDLRLPPQERAVHRLASLFPADINCADWNSNVAHLVAVGADNGQVKILDTRMLESPVDQILFPKSIQCLRWNNHLLGIGSDSLYIYDSQ